MMQAVWLSIVVSLLSTAIVVPVGTVAAWWLARRKGMWRIVTETIVMLPIVLPPLCTGYLLLILFGQQGPLGAVWRTLGLEIPFSIIAAVLAAFAVSLPFMIRAAQVAFEGIDCDLEDAARLMGASERDVFFKVTLPLAGRGVLAGGVLAFARAFGEFGATILFAGSIAGKTRTVPLAIFHYFNIPGGEQQVKMLMLAAVGVAALSMVAVHVLLPRPPVRR
jgi:molybdate transport system permease protein